MIESRTSPVIRLRGAPPGLEGLAPGSVVAERDEPLPVMVTVGEVEQLGQLDVTAVPAGAVHLRLALPETIRPGTYEGAVRAGDSELALVVEVEPWPNLHFTPSSLRLLVRRGEPAQAHVAVLNAGNVPLDIGRAQAFGLFADEGVERAFGIALRGDAGKGTDRLGRLVDGLAENHGGRVRVEVTEGVGVLEPGAVRDLGLVFHVPQGLNAERRYTGTLSIQGFGLAVHVDQAAEDGRAPRRAERARKAG